MIVCTTIIPTVGRATLSRAVCSVLDQRFDGHEVIVVNDSGQPLVEAAWQHDSRVTIITTQRRERSVARNSGAALARGRYLHFLDDDDYLLPGALSELSQEATKGFGWIYGATSLVDRAGDERLVLRHALEGNVFTQVMAGEWIPLQASLIEREAFFEVGGFNPLISGPEDVDLSRRVALRYGFAACDATVACVGMGEEGSTTPHGTGDVQSWRARERVLDQNGVWRRLYDSAETPYWQGRVVRAFASSAVWNLQHRHPLLALSRSGLVLYSLLRCSVAWGQRAFWQAIRHRHASFAFADGFEVAAHAGDHKKISQPNLKRDNTFTDIMSTLGEQQ